MSDSKSEGLNIKRDAGGISIVGRKSVNTLRMTMMLRGLILEEQSGGKMRLTRGPTCYSMVKREHGLRGNRTKVLKQFKAIVQKTLVDAKATPEQRKALADATMVNGA